MAWWVWSGIGFAGPIAALYWAGAGRTAWAGKGPIGFLGRRRAVMDGRRGSRPRAAPQKGHPPEGPLQQLRTDGVPTADAFEQSPPSSRSDKQLREYDYRLLEEIAKVMQQVWNQRSETADVDIQHATEWPRAERKIWNSLHGISADESKRRWQDRVSLIRFVQTNYQPMSSSSPGFPPPLVPDEMSPA